MRIPTDAMKKWKPFSTVMLDFGTNSTAALAFSSNDAASPASENAGAPADGECLLGIAFEKDGLLASAALQA